MSRKLGIMEGDLETGLYREQCGYPKPIDIVWALERQASQENCDGDPYESMIFAARYIRHLRTKIEALEAAQKMGADVGALPPNERQTRPTTADNDPS